MGKLYTGVNSQARKVSKLFVGANGAARQTRKAYVGVGGVARPLYLSGHDFTHYGAISSLSAGLNSPMCESLPSYVVFAGGGTMSSLGYSIPSTYTHAYNSAYTRSIPSALTYTSYGGGTACVGNYAIFAGGVSTTDYVSTFPGNTVNAFNNSLSRTTPAAMLGGAPNYPVGCAIGNYGVFGPVDSSGSGAYETMKTMMTYNTSLTRSSFTLLKHAGKVTRAGNFLLCANSYDYVAYNYLDTVEVYNSSLVRQTTVNLSQGGFPGQTASIGNLYGLFHGSINDAFDANLTRHALFEPLTSQSSCSRVSMADYAVFFGGGGTPNGEVVAYDKSLTRSIQGFLLEDRTNTAAGFIGKKMIVGGGYFNRTSSDTVEAFVLP